MIELDDDGDNFVLKSSLPAGAGSSVVLSPQDIMTLAQSAQLWTERIQSKNNPQSTDVSSVFVTPVQEIELHWDALKENILLTVVAPNGAKLTYELHQHLAAQLGESLSRSAAALKSEKGTAQ